MKWQDVEICACDCHKKYLMPLGTIIPEKLQPLLRESFLQSLNRQIKKGK